MRAFQVFLFLAAQSFLFNLTGASQGSIQGEISYKYNDYVGHKPDVGSQVFLFKKSNTQELSNTQVGLSGQFQFSNIGDGSYLIVVKSKNTNTSSLNAYSTVSGATLLVKDFFGVDLMQYESTYGRTVDSAMAEYQKVIFKPYTKKWVVAGKNLDKAVDSYFQNVVAKELPFLNWKNAREKVFIKSLEVKNGISDKIIFDFGVTYTQ